DVHGADLFFPPECLGAGHELVHAAPAIGHLENVANERQQVVGIEHGILTHLAEPFRSQRTDIAIPAYQDSDIAKETPDATNRLGAVEQQEKKGRGGRRWTSPLTD